MTAPARPLVTWRLGLPGSGPWAIVAGLLFLLSLAAAIAYLAPVWLSHPDLSHGLFTPILFFVLLHESRSRGRARFLPDSLATTVVAAFLLLLSLAALVFGCLYAVALDWSHALVTFIIGCAWCFALLAALRLAASASVRLVPWNWAAMAAIALWLLSLPLPPGTYARLTLQLQLTVTDGVLGSLHWLGIPATRNGNIIELARTSVGVEEACSGVRSLLSCVYAGVFFSGSLVRRPVSRLWLLLLAAPLAFVMNFLRSLLLTLLAHRGVDISGAWHDVTGFAILGLTAALLGALAVGLARGESLRESVSAAPIVPAARSPRPRLIVLSAGLGAGLVCAALFAAVTRPTDKSVTAPDLVALLPGAAPGWDFVAADNLYPYAGVLQTDHLAQRTYLRRGDGGVTQLTIYLAYWPPGEVPVSHVASHTPDICWPGAGWQLQDGLPRRERLSLSGPRDLSPAEFRHFTSESGPQYVWFWHTYDRRVIESPDALSPRDLLVSVLRFGIRSRGEQLFVRVSSNRPWREVQHEPLIQQVFSALAPYGI
jgi:exosortase